VEVVPTRSISNLRELDRDLPNRINIRTTTTTHSVNRREPTTSLTTIDSTQAIIIVAIAITIKVTTLPTEGTIITSQAITKDSSNPPTLHISPTMITTIMEQDIMGIVTSINNRTTVHN
jgi:hypothetical protein